MVLVWLGTLSLGNSPSCCHLSLPGIVTDVVIASGRIFARLQLIYTAGQSQHQLLTKLECPQRSESNQLPSRTLAVHIWKVNSEGTIPDKPLFQQAPSCGAPNFILIFNLGARKLGATYTRN